MIADYLLTNDPVRIARRVRGLATYIAEHAGRETAEVYGPPPKLADARAKAEAQGLTVRPAGPAIAIVGSERATDGAVPQEAIRRAASLEDVFVKLTGAEAE